MLVSREKLSEELIDLINVVTELISCYIHAAIIKIYSELAL